MPHPASADSAHGSRVGRAAHLAVSAITVAVFARAVPYPLQLHWDDGRFIADNPLVHEVSWRSLLAIVSAPHFEAYHPLHLLAYWLDVPWAGPHGGVLHAVNLLLWVAALNLLLRVFAGLGLNAPAAVLATLAFGLHPVQVEAVSWASGRKDVLALLFTCAAALLHLRSKHWLDRAAWSSRAGYLLAVLSKTSALPLPGVLLLADVLLRGRSLRRALAHHAPALALGAVLGGGVIAIWREATMIRGWEGGAAALPLRVAATIAHQSATALWPSANAPMYTTRAGEVPGVLAWIAACAVALIALWALRRGARRALFAIGAFTLWLLPVCNAVPMYFPYQDRYLSLPLIGLAFGLGAAVDGIAPALRGGGATVDAQRERGRARMALACFALMAGALALRAVQYQSEWSSETRLWGHAAATQPDAYYAFMKLGEVRVKSGDLHGAVRAYAQLLRIDPRRKLGHAALLRALALRDERIRGLSNSRADAYAADYYAQLDDPEALRALAGRMLHSGHLRALELPMRRALELQPVADAALERAAESHFANGRSSVGLFYLERMKRPTQRPDLQALAARARAQQADSPL
jgi:hypothetical protein